MSVSDSVAALGRWHVRIVTEILYHTGQMGGSVGRSAAGQLLNPG